MLNREGAQAMIPAMKNLRLNCGLALLLLMATTTFGNPPKPAGARAATSLGVLDLVVYQKATPDEDKAAIADAQAESKKVTEAIGITFAEIQTDHFIIFTDWDKREVSFLKQNMEQAYTLVATQFSLSPKENVFVGKLPIYMFANQSDFLKFADKIDGFPSLPRTVAGYFATRSDGWLHMTMWKPVANKEGVSLAQAERDWAYTLTHEFTHAFVARYRTNARVPRWLNEGIAEVVANGKFPRAGVRAYARQMANDREVDGLFDDRHMPGGDMYPVMMTMAEALIHEGPKKFLKYFNDIKDGTDPEKALQDNYKIDNNGLKEAWRKYIKNAK